MSPIYVASEPKLQTAEVHGSALHSITLYYTILHCITLYFTFLHCITLYYTILHYTALHYTILHCITITYTILHCITILYTILHCSTICYTIIHYVTQYYTMLHNTTLCYTILHFALHQNINYNAFCTSLQYTLQYSVHYTATTLQCEISSKLFLIKCKVQSVQFDSKSFHCFIYFSQSGTKWPQCSAVHGRTEENAVKRKIHSMHWKIYYTVC